VGAQFHRESRFPRPPDDPGRSDFPSPVLAVACPGRVFPETAELRAGSPTPHRSLVHSAARPPSASRRTPAQCPAVASWREPPRAQSPFARRGCYPHRSDLTGRLERRYPLVIAHTGSCARPHPSHRLQPWPRSVGLCRLLPAPAAMWPFPTLSLRVCPEMPGPMPRRVEEVHVPVTSLLGRRPSPRLDRVGCPQIVRSATSERGGLFTAAVISLCSGLPVCLPPRSLPPQRHCRRAAVAFPSEQNTCRCLHVYRIC